MVGWRARLFPRAHLIPYRSAPFNHFWYCLFVQRPAGLPDDFDGGEVGLKGVQRSNSILLEALAAIFALVIPTNHVGSIHSSSSRMRARHNIETRAYGFPWPP